MDYARTLFLQPLLMFLVKMDSEKCASWKVNILGLFSFIPKALSGFLISGL